MSIEKRKKLWKEGVQVQGVSISMVRREMPLAWRQVNYNGQMRAFWVVHEDSANPNPIVTTHEQSVLDGRGGSRRYPYHIYHIWWESAKDMIRDMEVLGVTVEWGVSNEVDDELVGTGF